MTRNIQKALNLIDHHFHTIRYVTEIADVVGEDYDPFRKQFTRETGISPAKKLHLKRVEVAKKLLSSTDNKLYAVAKMVGYKTEITFIKFFKRYMQMTPTEFRKAARKTSSTNQQLS